MGSTDDEPAPARALLWVLGRGWQHDSSCRVWPVGGAGRSSSSATSTSTALPWLPHALCLSSSEACWLGAMHVKRSEATTQDGNCSAKTAAQLVPEPQVFHDAIRSASQCMNPGAPAGLVAQALTAARSQIVPDFVATAAACRRCLQVQ